MMQRGTQRVQVGARVGIALILFGWGIAGCAEGRGLLALDIAGNIGTSNTKIDQVRSLVLGANDDIGGFDVTMHDWRRLLRQVVEDIQHF